MSTNDYDKLANRLESLFDRFVKMADGHHRHLQKLMLEVFDMKFDDLTRKIEAETFELRQKNEIFERELTMSDKMLYSHDERIARLETAA